MGGGSIGRRSAASEPASERHDPIPWPHTKKKIGKKKMENGKSRKKTKQRKTYPQHHTSWPAWAAVVCRDRTRGTRPWFVWRNKDESSRGKKGKGGKRDLNSGLGPVLKYFETTAINNPIQINRKFNAIPRTRPLHFPPSRLPPSMCLPFLAPTAGAPALATPPIYSRSRVSKAFLVGSDRVATVHRNHPFPFILPYFALSSQGHFHSSPSITRFRSFAIARLAQTRSSHLSVPSISFFQHRASREPIKM